MAEYGSAEYFEDVEITDDRLAEILENEMYKALLIVERMEDAGRFGGNGHHFAQKMSAIIKMAFKYKFQQGRGWLSKVHEEEYAQTIVRLISEI